MSKHTGSSAKKDYNTSSFINECFRGFGYYAYHSRALSKLSPENRDLFLSTYQESLGLPEINLSQWILKYQQARESTLESLPVALEKNPERLQELEASFKTLDSAIKKIGSRFHPSNLTQYIEEERQKAIGRTKHGHPPNEEIIKGVIMQQYEEDVRRIKAELTDPTAQKNALATLESAYKSQLQTLEEDLKKDIDTIHRAAEQERLRVSTFATLRHENEQMKRAFDAMYLEKAQPEGSTVTMHGESGIFENLDFDSLCNYVNGNFKTLTGRDLNVTQTGTSPKTYQFQLSLPSPSKFHARFSDWGYYSDPSNRAMQDMLVMAKLLKLSGEESPCARITGFDPELAIKLAQDAFAALRMAGYPEDKIKIVVNGKSYSAEDKENNLNALFKANPARQQEIMQYIAMHEEKPNQESSERIKQTIESEREKYKAAVKDKAPSSTPPSAETNAERTAEAAPAPTDPASSATPGAASTRQNT